LDIRHVLPATKQNATASGNMPDIVRRSGKLERETPKGCAASDFIIRTGLGGAYHLQRVLKL